MFLLVPRVDKKSTRGSQTAGKSEAMINFVACFNVSVISETIRGLLIVIDSLLSQCHLCSVSDLLAVVHVFSW